MIFGQTLKIAGSGSNAKKVYEAVGIPTRKNFGKDPRGVEHLVTQESTNYMDIYSKNNEGIDLHAVEAYYYHNNQNDRVSSRKIYNSFLFLQN